MPLMRVLKLFTRCAKAQSRADSAAPREIFSFRFASAGRRARVAANDARRDAGRFAQARIWAGLMFVSRLKVASVSRGQAFMAWTPV